MSCKAIAALVLAVMGVCGAAGAETRTSERMFVDEHMCELTVRVEQIRNSRLPGRPLRKDRFIILSAGTDQHRFVQCIFFEGDRKILCEAASGHYATRHGRSRDSVVGPGEVAALKELGFDTSEQAGNFQIELDATKPRALNRVAELILTALFRGYGAHPGAKVSYTAPWGPGGKAVAARCRPNS
jgi:hypothetical protein